MLPLSLHRTRRVACRLPKRFQDILPEAPFPLPPPDVVVPPQAPPNPGSRHTQLAPLVILDPSIHSAQPPSSSLQHHPVIVTQTNSFGLFCLYAEGSIPIDDPEDQSGQDPLRGGIKPGPVMSLPSDLENLFHPYPNENSWCISDWYWNHGPQKSKKGFENLIKIIGSVDFQSEDLRHTNWHAIDHELSCLDIDGSSHEARSNHGGDLQDWLPESDGWMRRSITISVLFSRHSLKPGPKNYTISNFYCRSLLSIIHDKLSDPLRCRVFRFEPYLLWWKRSSESGVDGVGIYGELFYSQAFLAAHRQLQDPLPDPSSCTLPRRIIALMFWSDATQLTSFGNTKLWPLYVYFGNESKYQRCSPTANLCSHAAYFQTVCSHVDYEIQI